MYPIRRLNLGGSCFLVQSLFRASVPGPAVSPAGTFPRVAGLSVRQHAAIQVTADRVETREEVAATIRADGVRAERILPRTIAP